MRNLLDPDQMLSPGRIRTATVVLTLFLAAAAALMTLIALGNLFTLKIGAAVMQVAFGVGVPLAIWLIVRILSEMLLAQHRLNDRLSVIAERLGEQRVAPGAEPDAAPSPAPVVEDAEDEPEASAPEAVEPAPEEEPKPKRRRRSAAADKTED